MKIAEAETGKSSPSRTTSRRSGGAWASPADQVGANLQEAMQYPSLNVRGMAAAAVGDKAANIVPDRAIAEIDLRTTPEAARSTSASLKDHIEAGLPPGRTASPTRRGPRRHDKLATFTHETDGRAVRTPLESPLGRWAYGALPKTSQPGEPVRIRMMGGSVPTDSLGDPRRAVRDHPAGERRQQPARVRREHAGGPLRRGSPTMVGLLQRASPEPGVGHIACWHSRTGPRVFSLRRR